MVGVARGIVQRDGVLRMYKYGDNLKHGQCTDGKILHNWSGTCTPPGQLRGGGYVRIELRVDGFASLSVSDDQAVGGGLSLGQWSTRVREWDDCSFPSADFQTVTMTLDEPSRLMLNVITSSGGKLLVEALSSETGATLTGHSAANCTEIVGDYTSIAAEWDGGQLLPSGALSLRFLLFGEVDLHAFWFEA
jgi:hypothetical protein